MESLDTAVTALTPDATQQAIARNLPAVDQHGEIVEAVGPDTIRIRLPFRPEFMGASPWGDGTGHVYSGPMVMGFADTSMYCCVMATMGSRVAPVMVNIAVTFLRPPRAADLIAEARMVRRGGRLHYLESWLRSDGDEEPCAHATSTYRVARLSS